MTGKAGEKLSATGRDNAQPPINQLWDEIEARFGVCPSFFKLAQYEPSIARNLFRFAEFAYLDSPMPARFKERLFTWLSRFCEVRYCVARHCAFLLGRGRVAGDASAPPLSAEQALALLKEPMPAKEELPEYLRALEETPAPLGDWPDFDSDLGRRFRIACAVVFLDPAHSAPWLQALRRLLGPQRYEQLMLFLVFVGAAHFWTEVRPELAFEPDLESVMREHETLAEPLLHSADEAARWKLGQRLYDEMQSLREDLKIAEALRESAARFHNIVDTAPAMLWVTEPDGRCTFLSRGWYEFTGQTEQEDLGKDGFGWLDVVHPDDREESGRVFLEANMKREPFTLDYRLRQAGGAYRWAIDAGPRFDEAGAFLGYVGLVIDITERRENEVALRESESRFRQMSESLPQLVWTCRADGWCDYLSPQWVAYTGIPEDEQLGFGWLQQLHLDEREPIFRAWMQAVADGSRRGRWR